jgi:hypothetical protein
MDVCEFMERNGNSFFSTDGEPIEDDDELLLELEILISEKMKARLKILARDQGMTIAEAVVYIVDEYISDN